MRAPKVRKAPSTSITRQVEAFAQAGNLPEPPYGLRLRGKVERARWEGYMRQRPTDNWGEGSLTAVHDLVKLETTILQLTRSIEKNGRIIINTRGEERVNPLLESLRASQRAKIAQQRLLGLADFAGSGAGAVDRRATKQENEARAAEAQTGGRSSRLFAV
jgi:putative heme degradation protein